MLSCMRKRDYSGDMLLLSARCENINGMMLEFLEHGTEPDPERLKEAARLMTQKGRLEERRPATGLVINKVFVWTMREHKKPLPKQRDFRTLANANAAFEARKAAAKRVLGFFMAVTAKALWFFEQPPDFDGIIAREVVESFEKMK